MMHQFAPPLSVTTPFGRGLALLMQYDDFDIYWCVAQGETNEIWWWHNQYIRLGESITANRATSTPFYLPPDFAKAIERHAARHTQRPQWTHDKTHEGAKPCLRQFSPHSPLQAL